MKKGTKLNCQTKKGNGNSQKKVNSYTGESNRSDVYQKFTELIISKLDQGIIPWRKPWNDMGAPSNYFTKKSYQGINLWLLASYGHKYPFYLTFRQAKNLGGKIKKGAKACPICFWNFVYIDKETGNKIPEKEVMNFPKERISKHTFLREYKVFPIEEIEGIEWELPSITKDPLIPINKQCHQIWENMHHKPNLINQGSEAYYRKDLDEITMPSKNLISQAEAYYGVLFHEMIHSTGHESRLMRKGIMEPHLFGSAEYSKEELIAEMGAGYLNNLTGILNEELLENSTAYIKHWITEFKNDKHLLIKAATQAQKAVDYILRDYPL